MYNESIKGFWIIVIPSWSANCYINGGRGRGDENISLYIKVREREREKESGKNNLEPVRSWFAV